VDDAAMKMFDAMILKREIVRSCNIDVEILETLKEGFFLRFENITSKNTLALIADLVRKHELNMLLDNGVYFISKDILSPLKPTFLSE
jgi:hypothetical protein